MILIADMCEPDRYETAGGSFKNKRKFEAMTGHPCVVMNYPDVNTDFVERYDIKAIFITGTGYLRLSVPRRELDGRVPARKEGDGELLQDRRASRVSIEVAEAIWQPVERAVPNASELGCAEIPGHPCLVSIHRYRGYSTGTGPSSAPVEWHEVPYRDPARW